MSEPIAGVLLAAGSSLRFGEDKLLHPLPDGTPLALAAAAKLITVLPDSVAVVRDASGQLARLLASAGLELIVNPQASEGMGTSIACAVAARPNSGGWVITLADMPWLRGASIAAVVAAIESGADIAAPVYRNRRGHPVGFSTAWYAALSQLDGDRGARALLAEQSAAVTRIDVDDAGVVADVDTPEDLDFGRLDFRQ